jgi:FdhD protein
VNDGDRTRRNADVWVVEDGRAFALPDELAAEEPLEIRLVASGTTTPVAVTMRTPGHDRELAAGFLFSEGVIRGRDDVTSIDTGVEERAAGAAAFVRVELRSHVAVQLARMERHFFASSACGVCGKSEVESLVLGKVVERRDYAPIEAAVLYSLPDRLRAAQSVFSKTGGLHAAALFTRGGDLAAVREDVGRHNALDKLIGAAVLDGTAALPDATIMVSGRASYELVQKCSMAEVPMLCAVSAPSSMAVSLARRLGLTLVGFLRGRRFNVYSAPERIAGVAASGG